MDTYSSTPYQSSTGASGRHEQSEDFLFVGGIPLFATLADIKLYFKNFGQVKSIDLPKNRKGKLKGFAYVRFSNPIALQRALLQPLHYLWGKKIGVHRGIRPSLAAHLTKDMQHRKIFVTNLDRAMTETKIYELFSQYGSVEKVLVPKDGIEGRGFCYVIMRDTSVFHQLLSLGNIQYMGRPVYLDSAVSMNMLHTADTEWLGKDTFQKKSIRSMESSSSQQPVVAKQLLIKNSLGANSQLTQASSKSQQVRGLMLQSTTVPTLNESEDNYRFNVVCVW